MVASYAQRSHIAWSALQHRGAKETKLLDGRAYTDPEIAELRAVTRDEAPVLAVADFSPGPWWGFNGVQTLVLTGDKVSVVQRGLAFTSGRLRRSIPTTSVRTFHWHISQRLGREAVHMTLSTGDRTRRYASKYRQGAHLAEQLADLVELL